MHDTTKVALTVTLLTEILERFFHACYLLYLIEEENMNNCIMDHPQIDKPFDFLGHPQILNNGVQ